MEQALTVTNVLEAIRPFQADDNHKGTFLILRIAGLEQSAALRLVSRKFRSWQHWRTTDPYFKSLDDAIPTLAQRFGGEARVVRTAMLDISIIEAGISIFRRILRKEPVNDSMWSYATKLAGIRMPMMGAEKESGSPWERLANSIKNTLAQRELTIAQEPDGTRSITAKEIVVEPSPEQRRAVDEVVRNILQQAGVAQ